MFCLERGESWDCRSAVGELLVWHFSSTSVAASCEKLRDYFPGWRQPSMVQRNMGVGGPASCHKHHPFAFYRSHHDSNLKMCICGNWLSRASYLVRLSFMCLTVLLWRAWRLLLPDGTCATFSHVRVACSSPAFPLQCCRVSAAGRTLPSLQRGTQTLSPREMHQCNRTISCKSSIVKTS